MFKFLSIYDFLICDFPQANMSMNRADYDKLSVTIYEEKFFQIEAIEVFYYFFRNN